MKLFATAVFAASFAELSLAHLHNAAICVENRVIQNHGGTGVSVSYWWSKDYDIMLEATRCACEYYSNRNTGDEKQDTCPDCTFDGTQCNSAEYHIGGDEMNHYCTKYCGAEGSEAN